MNDTTPCWIWGAICGLAAAYGWNWLFEGVSIPVLFGIWLFVAWFIGGITLMELQKQRAAQNVNRLAAELDRARASGNKAQPGP
jgi:fatty acid desaturase